MALAFVMCGCSNLFPPKPIPTKGDFTETPFFVVEYDSCEYIMRVAGYKGFLSHKDACLEMAQWKDEQFSKFLLWLDDNFVIRKFTNGESMTYGELIDNFKSNSYEPNTTKTD